MQPITDDRAADTAAPEPPSSEECVLALFCHLGGLILGFVVPLVLWLLQRKESRYIADQGKEALNFQITLLLGAGLLAGAAWLGIVVAAVRDDAILNLVAVLVLLLAVILLAVLELVFCALGGVAAIQGQWYRYPFNIRFVR